MFLDFKADVHGCFGATEVEIYYIKWWNLVIDAFYWSLLLVHLGNTLATWALWEPLQSQIIKNAPAVYHSHAG